MTKGKGKGFFRIYKKKLPENSLGARTLYS